MKKIWWLLLVAVLLCGCSAQQVAETVSDELLLSTMAPQKELSVKLPANASQATLAAEDGAQLYFCDDYTLTVQTCVSGDLDRTVRALCGYGAKQLTGLIIVHTHSTLIVSHCFESRRLHGSRQR